jgi:hypothetical protein
MAPRDREPGDASEAMLRFHPWAHPGEIKVYASREYADELYDDLTAAGIGTTRALENSILPNLPDFVLLVAVGTASAWRTLGQVITAFLERHKGTEIEATIMGQPFLAKGYSKQDVERFLTHLRELHDDETKQYQRHLDRRPKNAGKRDQH